jgi:carboxyl-terminal processing protease
MVDLFIDHVVIVRVKGRNRPERIERASSIGTLPDFPMVVLVNEQSASAAEIVSGSLQDNRRAVVVGTRSYGKGSVQEVVPLEGDSGELKITVAYYYLPSGRLVHRKKDAKDWGVEPQIVVPLDEATEKQVFIEMSRSERFRRPTLEGATRPATQPTTQPIDTQLQRAKDTLVALLAVKAEGRGDGALIAAAPATAPVATTQP